MGFFCFINFPIHLPQTLPKRPVLEPRHVTSQNFLKASADIPMPEIPVICQLREETTKKSPESDLPDLDSSSINFDLQSLGEGMVSESSSEGPGSPRQIPDTALPKLGDPLGLGRIFGTKASDMKVYEGNISNAADMSIADVTEEAIGDLTEKLTDKLTDKLDGLNISTATVVEVEASDLPSYEGLKGGRQHDIHVYRYCDCVKSSLTQSYFPSYKPVNHCISSQVGVLFSLFRPFHNSTNSLPS